MKFDLISEKFIANSFIVTTNDLENSIIKIEPKIIKIFKRKIIKRQDVLKKTEFITRRNNDLLTKIRGELF